jgi:hypothetical protein
VARPSCSPQTWALYLARLAESGFSEEDGRALGLRPLDDARELGPTHFACRPCVHIPYLDPGTGGPLSHLPGNPPFYRVRYLGPEAPGFGQQAEGHRARRYAQPAGTSVCAYFAPDAVDWPALLADPSGPLILTEGEFKAAKACLEGFPTVGLGGVWNWRSAEAGVDFLPELAGIEWRGRKVFVAFDSDYHTNPMVCQALSALAEELYRRGADPWLLSLPEPEDGGKVGLDDFLVTAGAGALAGLLSEAQSLTLARPLMQLNREVVYVRDPGLVVVRETRQRLSPQAFANHAFSARPYAERMLDRDGVPKLRPAKAAQAWLSWPVRSELGRMTYAPGEPEETSEGGQSAFNLWPGWGCEPKKGDVKPFLRLVDHLFTGAEPEAVTWFLRWLAYPLQHPGYKLTSSAAVWGVKQGTGKSLLGYTMRRIYGKNFVEIRQKDLESTFTEWAENKQFVMGDDVTGSNKRNYADMLKGMISQETMRINVKMIPSYDVPDRINYLWTSNHPDAFFMDDDDRRFFVHEVTVDPMADSYYHDYERWLDAEGGPALFDWFLRLDLGDFNPRAAAFKTRARERMVSDGKSDLGAWVSALKIDPEGVLRVGDLRVEGELFSARELLDLYDPSRRTGTSANGLARELRRAGFPIVADGAPFRGGDGRLDRFYAVVDRPKWARAKPKACEAHLRARFSGARVGEPRF